MTIHVKQPEKLIVNLLKVPTDQSDSLENHWKYHCPSCDMLKRWGTCVKSDLISVIKSCAVCLLITWICWLQWSNYQLSVDVLELKNEFSSIGFRASESQLEKNPITNEQPEVTDFDGDNHLVFKHSAKKRKRRKRRHRDGKVKRAINDSCSLLKDYMKRNTYALFLPGINEPTTVRGYFKWNLTYAGTDDQFITSNSNGTFTFKREGFYLVASQVTVKGMNNQQNYGISYGYKTVLVKGNQDEVLMLSEITQDNRGICYRNAENLKRCATDSISHLVMRYFQKNDRIAIKSYTNMYQVNYYLTEKNSYFAIVALDLWNV